MLSNYFVFINLFNCVSTSRPPYITRIIVTTCVSSSGIYKTRYMLQAYQADHLHFLVSAYPFSHTGLSISDSLKSVRKTVLIYETIIANNKSLFFNNYCKITCCLRKYFNFKDKKFFILQCFIFHIVIIQNITYNI